MSLTIVMTILFVVLGFLGGMNYVLDSMHKKEKKEEETMCMDNAYFKLRDAGLCVQCETIFSKLHFRSCPGCGSEAIFVVNMALQTNSQLQQSAIANVKGITIQ